MATAQEALQQNLVMRQIALARYPRQRKELITVTGTAGETNRVKLFNVGIITKLLVHVRVNYTPGMSNAKLSPKAPWNMIKRIQLQDYEGFDRINLTGYQLWVINSVRKRTPAFLNNENTKNRNGSPVFDTATTNPTDAEFIIEIPLAYNENNDLRGAILAQTGVGDLHLNITWNDTMSDGGNDDAVFISNTLTTVNSITATVMQDFLFPQPVANGQVALPLADLSTVYELNGALRMTDNVADGQERLLNYPNVRSVIGIYANWMNNGIMRDTISRLRLIANGNNVLIENSLSTQLHTQREWCNSDLPAGTFFMTHRDRPIETAQYGNVQLGVTFSAPPVGYYYLEQAYESFYAKGATLPGVVQA